MIKAEKDKVCNFCREFPETAAYNCEDINCDDVKKMYKTEKDINKSILEMNKAHTKYETCLSVLESKITPLCDFDAGISHCKGDGHLVINIATSQVAPLTCLIGKTTTNKLDEFEHDVKSI